jgi:hypothetical protein
MEAIQARCLVLNRTMLKEPLEICWFLSLPALSTGIIYHLKNDEIDPLTALAPGIISDPRGFSFEAEWNNQRLMLPMRLRLMIRATPECVTADHAIDCFVRMLRAVD